VNIYSPLEHAFGIPWVIQAAVLAILLLLAASVVVRRSIAATNGGVIPDEGLSIRNIFEVILTGLAQLAESTIGPEYRKHLPLVASIFFFILLSNLLGLIPAIGGATSDVNTCLAWAVLAWCTYTYTGIRHHGFGYLRKFMGPSFDVHWFGRHMHLPLMAPFMMLIELPLDVARMFTLTIRLLANMFADHTVLAVWLTLTPILVPAVFLGLGVVICIIQAFVFSLLTMIYIGLALEEAH
jgi:F-type H+-transporting ATPase subunit a